MQQFERIFRGIHSVITSMQNTIEYSMRQRIKWRRGMPAFSNESKENLFAHLPQERQSEAYAKADRLKSKYHLDYLWHHGSADNYRVNLFYLEMLDKAFSQSFPIIPTSMHTADIGVSDWFYVHSLHACLRWWNTSSPRSVQLTGYEADAYRVYDNLFSRYDYARRYVRGVEHDATYVPKRFTPQPNLFDMITLFFPFMFLKDHLIWGLPKRKFNPQKLFEEALCSLRNQGVLFIVNQGEQEHEAQKKMIARHGLKLKSSFKHTSLFYHYDIPRYVLLAIK